MPFSICPGDEKILSGIASQGTIQWINMLAEDFMKAHPFNT